jgi:hypothetical protein
MTRSTNPILTAWASVGVVLAMFAVSAAAWAIDTRTLNGVSIWAKPMKFNLSFALHLATLMIFVALLRREVQERVWMRWTLILTSAAVLLELLYIFTQAARGRASHFNFETHWETVAYYGLMGGAAVAVMIGTLIVGLAAWRGAREDIGPGLRTGIVLGAVVGTIATFVTTGALASGAVTPTGHWIGGELSDASGLPITGWSTTGGDLRVSHFFATHLLQALPILGWFADRTLSRLAPLIVWAGTAAGVAIVWLTFTQALAARPFLSLAGL